VEELFAEPTLFAVEKAPPVKLADKFVFPPFSVLDRRQGEWQNRKRKWLQLGIKSEVGRGQNLAYKGQTTLNNITENEEQVGTSVFDPVICEVAYRWFSPEGGDILDPFAGGSVRGIIASKLNRNYTGYDIRPEQVDSNYEQSEIANPDFLPQWIASDIRDDKKTIDYDFVFTCPPYADLEVYSDDPRDLSTMPYEQFLEQYKEIFAAAVSKLKNNRFVGIVISDVRSKKKSGHYYGLVADTINVMREIGCELYNDIIIVDPVGTLAIRSEAQMRASRKVGRGHQHLLIFVKGDAKQATKDLGEI
jgi:DNA modification methylase